MALLTLQDVGKIYVSEGNVAVGIRGVNLSFDKGEFVAITGKSGSGKSTLLNVISGMDTYEEGEMLIEGEPTSHFLQKDWEEYRKQYISFIFQDYNIIESFTVLQNVELALMHIENPAERRKRALELLRRVGLEKHLHHKGSKLSGGQKQRTVIARALAKDSPIILADEPTGNLDSQTSKEIVALLKEVSKDKLLIMVTHNFDQVENVATRQIRIFDGSVESDTVLQAPLKSGIATRVELPKAHKKQNREHSFRNGLHLGVIRFRSTPKLSAFLCFLMILTTLVVTLITALSGDATDAFSDQKMFTHANGRTVLVRTDGKVMTDEEVTSLAKKVGAESALHYDFMLDQTVSLNFGDEGRAFRFGKLDENVHPQVGRLPAKENEVFISVPIAYEPIFGKDYFAEKDIPLFNGTFYTLVGVDYYYDNTIAPTLYFSESGYETASALAYFYMHQYDSSVTVFGENGSSQYYHGSNILVDFTVPENKISAFGNDLENFVKANGQNEHCFAKLQASFTNYDYGSDDWYGGYFAISYADSYASTETTVFDLEGYSYSDEKPALLQKAKDYASQDENYRYNLANYESGNYLLLNPKAISDFLYEEYYPKSYTQASLFFKNDTEAHGKVKDLRQLGYIAVVSDTTVQSEVMDTILIRLAGLFKILGWFLTVVFATLFLSLCSSKAMGATKGNIAIMRSMGITAPVIKISTYVQTFLSLIPAFLVTAVGCFLIYTNPKTNGIFVFLHFKDYLILGVAMILVAFLLSRKYVKKMFDESVKKTLRGGAQQ